MKKKQLLLAIGAALILGAGVTLAQNPGNRPGAPATSAAKSGGRGGEVILSSKGGNHDDAKGISRLTGNVVVKQEGEDFILYADSVTYDRKANQAVATGNLRVETRDSTITGLNLRANFDAKRIVIKGNVVMNSHGKDTGMKKTPERGPGDAIGDIAHKPSRMACDTIDFNYDIREALVTGNIRLTQGETRGTCRQITFDEENNIAELEGNVLFTNKEGQTFAVNKLVVWFDDDKLDFQGPVTLKGKNQEPTASKTPAPTQSKRNFGKAPTVPDIEPEPADEKAPATTPAPADSKKQ